MGCLWISSFCQLSIKLFGFLACYRDNVSHACEPYHMVQFPYLPVTMISGVWFRFLSNLMLWTKFFRFNRYMSVYLKTLNLHVYWMELTRALCYLQWTINVKSSKYHVRIFALFSSKPIYKFSVFQAKRGQWQSYNWLWMRTAGREERCSIKRNPWPDAIYRIRTIKWRFWSGTVCQEPWPRIYENTYQLWKDQLNKHPELRIIHPIRNPKDTLVSYYHHCRNDSHFGGVQWNLGSILPVIQRRKASMGWFL